VGPSVFFWTIAENKESHGRDRPIGGMSACNVADAKAVVGLVKFLLAAGVPNGAISVITPYKGQKTLIQRELRSAKVTSYKPRPQQQIGGYGRPSTSGRGQLGRGSPALTSSTNDDEILVSTVDRFQGDENDVIILSLVRVKPGNQFVALPNRFIVATSRARLGFFIVGAKGAVAGAPHWNRMIKSLQEPLLLTDAECCGYGGARIGETLPVCCPRHRFDTQGALRCFPVASPENFPSEAKWNDFCNEICPHTLYCGHSCAVPCHSPTTTPHTSDAACAVAVQHPCTLHAHLPLHCRDVAVSKANRETLKTALDRYAAECPAQVKYHRPECDHEVLVACHQHQSLQHSDRASMEAACPSGVKPFKLPHCAEVVSDFVHPQVRCARLAVVINVATLSRIYHSL
jgi:hypothetical protein